VGVAQLLKRFCAYLNSYLKVALFLGSTKKFKNQQKQEITGIICLALALLTMVSLVSPKMGIISSFSEYILRGIAGKGRYLLPVLLAFFGFRLIQKKTQLRTRMHLYGLILLSITFLTVLNILSPPSYEQVKLQAGYNPALQTWPERSPFCLYLLEGLKGKGGGLTGALFYLVLVRSFGHTGTYIILATLGLVGVLLSANVSLEGLNQKIGRSLKNLGFKLKQAITNFLFTEVEVEVEIGEEPAHQALIIDRSGTNSESSLPSNKDVNPGSNTINNPSSKTPPTQKITVNPYASETEIAATVMPDENVIKTEKTAYQLPPVNLLTRPGRLRGLTVNQINKNITENIRVLEETLDNFGVKVKVTQVSRGPVVTRYEIHPPSGIKVSRIMSLADDIALCLAAPDVRIEAPIPGKAAIGIEIPNNEIAVVYLRELIETVEFQQSTSWLTVALGKDIAGKPVIADLTRMPHLLIAGATGAGKSVCLNTLIASILFKASPEQVKFLIIDPKMVELTTYNGIPHLATAVVTSPQRAAGALRWAVKEMERRYELFAAVGARDITRYNNYVQGTSFNQKPVPLMVIVIDELADLMMVAPAEVEDSICRLAQMARATGIHLVVATQRPSVDVITGLIKANIPSRISFAVSSQIDSRTILDMAGAEKLLGRGDMLFLPVGITKPCRVQGAYLSDHEVENLVTFLKKQTQDVPLDCIGGEIAKEEKGEDKEDELMLKAAKIFLETGHASVSLLQRRLHLGYAKAARLVDVMENKGIIGSHEGSKPRPVLITTEELPRLYQNK